MVVKTKSSYDKEWINLMITAKRLNITPEEVRKFFQKAAKKRNDSSVASSSMNLQNERKLV